jgi:amidase
LALRPPTGEELHALAEELGIELSSEERRAVPGLLGGMLAAYAVLDSEPEGLPEAPPVRESWWPTPEENPHNAWYVRTSIRSSDSGLLAGRSVAVKDNVMVAGVPMSNGSSLLAGFVPEVDATVVTRLLDAGAEIRGMANCECLCLSAGSHTCAAGPVHNPHRRGYSAGGSSSGSAVLVACGEVDLAIGGDQGGSIRIPSALCGTVGMKPTFGLVPYTGAAPLEPTIDHLGPITSNVRDNALMLQVLAGPDGIDGRQQGAPSQPFAARIDDDVAGLRIGVVREGFGRPGFDAAVDASVRSAVGRLEERGASARTISIPMHATAATLALPILLEGVWHTVVRGDGMGAGRTDLYVPGYAKRMRAWRERAGELPLPVRLMILAGCFVDRHHGHRFYAKAVNTMRRVRAAYDAALAQSDLLVMPTVPFTARPLPPADRSIEEDFAAASLGTVNTQPFNVSHHPALSVPCGRLDGLPVGMMLVGRHHAEATLYRVARALERAADWRTL